MDDFGPKLRELLAQGMPGQCVELCRALGEEALLLESITETPQVVDHARGLLEALCPDTETARRVERLWACDCLSERLPVLSEPGAEEKARRHLRLAVRIGEGLVEPIEAPGLQHIPPRFRAQFRQRLAQSVPMAHGVEGLAESLTQESFSGAQIAQTIRQMLPQHTSTLAIQERARADQLSRTARYGALGPNARQLRAQAARATEKAALAEVHAQMGYSRLPGTQRAVSPKVIDHTERVFQARLLAVRCTPHLRPAESD